MYLDTYWILNDLFWGFRSDFIVTDTTSFSLVISIRYVEIFALSRQNGSVKALQHETIKNSVIVNNAKNSTFELYPPLMIWSLGRKKGVGITSHLPYKRVACKTSMLYTSTNCRCGDRRKTIARKGKTAFPPKMVTHYMIVPSEATRDHHTKN